MKKAILATKVGMTQIFDENGVLVPVTVLQAGPCVVTQVKTADNDGYSAIQVGFGEKKENRGDRKEQVTQDRVQQELLSGQAAELYSLQYQEITLSK